MAAVLESAVAVDLTDDPPGDVWASIARSYKAFASPFVPSREDIAAFESAVSMQADSRKGQVLKALMLGVTPGIASMDWPQPSRLVAVEISQPEIDALWPGDIPQVREAVCGTWFSLPVDGMSCDAVLGDGSLSTSRFPAGFRQLIHGVADVLVDGGLFVARTYVRPNVQESVEAVFSELFAGEGMSVDHFKMRLYLAMQRSPQEGVAVRDAATMLKKFNLNGQVMRGRLGWSDAAIEPFLRWPSSDAVYSFPTLNELRSVLGERFDEVSVTFPQYELGHCCPIMAMRVRAEARGGSLYQSGRSAPPGVPV